MRRPLIGGSFSLMQRCHALPWLLEPACTRRSSCDRLGLWLVAYFRITRVFRLFVHEHEQLARPQGTLWRGPVRDVSW